MSDTITYSNRDAIGANASFMSALLTADGSLSPNIECGFQPTKIVLYNYTGTNPNMYVWIKGMTSGSYWLTTGSTGVVTKVSSGGPTVFAGDSDESMGITIPAALLTAADTWLIECSR